MAVRMGLWVMASLVLMTAGFAQAAASSGDTPKEQLFLMKVAQKQKGEIELGTMATNKAANDDVKQFGQKIVEDHMKAQQEVKQIASQEGIQLPQEMAAMQKEKAKRFEQLSGKEFDKAFIRYMLRDHVKDVTEFEHSAKELKDPQVQQWAAKTLPVLKEHLTIAKTIAEDLGVDMKEVQME